MTFEIKTVDELINPELEARWAARRVVRDNDVFRAALAVFVEHGGPVRAEDIARRLPGRSRDDVTATLATLDAEDVLLLEQDAVVIAYPFSGVPNDFAVDLGDGRDRYACCAIDALGLAPMIGRRVHIRSRCHDCAEPLALDVTPDGPLGGDGMFVWLGKRVEGERVCTTL